MNWPNNCRAAKHLTSRWPLLVHPVSVRTGVGAPSARRSKYGVLLYVLRNNTPRRFLENLSVKIAEFLHAVMNRDSKKKSFSDFGRWIAISWFLARLGGSKIQKFSLFCFSELLMTTLKPNFPPTARRNYQEQPAGKAYEKKLAKKRPFLCRLGKSRFRAMLFFHPRSQLFVVF